MPSYRLYPLILMILMLILDQASKIMAIMGDASGILPMNILPFLDFLLIYNPGISFSLLANSGEIGRYILIIVTVVIIWIFAKMLLKSHNLWYNMALALIISGALGNLIDRVIHGKVVDFIYFHMGNFHFPVFNMADSAITVGGALFLLLSIKGNGNET